MYWGKSSLIHFLVTHSQNKGQCPSKMQNTQELARVRKMAPEAEASHSIIQFIQ